MPGDVTTRPVTADDLPAILALHALVFGPGRFARTAYRVREGTPAISPYCRAAFIDGALVAALRMTAVTVGGKGRALLLGPLAVHPDHANKGYGRRLIAECIDAARSGGERLVVLVGDAPYYGRLGFIAVPPGRIVLPGPADPARILACELVPDALAEFSGLVGR